MKSLRRLAAVVASAVLASCATVHAPTLAVRHVGKAQIGVTGARLQVTFSVRNPNPEELLVERFDYELILNGRHVGHGYVSEPFPLPGFAEQRVVSDLELSFLKLPGAIHEVLEQDRVRARASGHFYVRARGEARRLAFDSEAQVELR
jgi:LEA14-like dessication related protein